MRIRVIGLGQCGSFVVYDVLAHLFDAQPSKELRSATKRPDYQIDLARALNRIRRPIASASSRVARYFLGFKATDLPKFFVIDGNVNNPMISGLTRENTSGPEELDIAVVSLPLTERNTGCSYGQVGEYYFRREKNDRANSIYRQMDLGNSDATDISVIVFAGGGGSGSGGAVVLNEQMNTKNSLLFNMMVLPPYDVAEFRQRFNTGRAITRLSASQQQSSLLLFSNLSDDLNDQYAVNKYIRDAVIRLANMGFPGNVPKWGTDVDISDLKSFFMGRPAFMGLSSSARSDQGSASDIIEEVVKRAVRFRTGGEEEGLSIEIGQGQEELAFAGVNKVLAVIGVPPSINAAEVNAPSILRHEIAERLGKPISKLDIAVFSYGSLSDVEVTIFFRYNKYSHCHLLGRFFDDGFFRWYKGEKDELDYFTQEEDEENDNTDLKDIYKFLIGEMGVQDLQVDPSVRESLNYQLVRPS